VGLVRTDASCIRPLKNAVWPSLRAFRFVKKDTISKPQTHAHRTLYPYRLGGRPLVFSPVTPSLPTHFLHNFAIRRKYEIGIPPQKKKIWRQGCQPHMSELVTLFFHTSRNGFKKVSTSSYVDFSIFIDRVSNPMWVQNDPRKWPSSHKWLWLVTKKCLGPMTPKCLGPDVWRFRRFNLKIQTVLRTPSQKSVPGQRSNPKLLEKPWAGGTLFFWRFRCYNSQGLFRAVTKSSESCLEREKQEKNLPNLLLQEKNKKRQKLSGLLVASCALSTLWKQAKYKVKMVADPDPLSTRSTWPFATCDTSLWARRSQQRETSSLAFKVA